MTDVVVIGAGMAGARCAQVLAEHRVSVRLCERGRTPGGRMASPLIDGRRVDLGASYFTVGGDRSFADTVARWQRQGIVAPWTTEFDVVSGSLSRDKSVGPLRWAAPDGLQAVVAELCGGLEVETGREVSAITCDGPGSLSVDGVRAKAVLLAVPDGQGRPLLPETGPLATLRAALVVDSAPVIAVSAGWDERVWPFQHGVFVNEHPTLTFVADDGARRGDGAPVLVGHTTASLAATCLENPEAAVEAVLESYRQLFGVTSEPNWTSAYPWASAKPTSRHSDSFGWHDWGIGICSDAWCPAGQPRVESAWLSGTALAEHVLRWLA